MNIIDLHCDTVMELAAGKGLAGLEGTHISLEKLRKGGVMAQCFAIFVPTGASAEKHGLSCTPEEYFDTAYAAFIREMEANPDSIRQALCADDIIRNADEGVISAVLTVEDCVTLRGRIENIDGYYKKGVRMAALTWNYENTLGYPNSFDRNEHAKGLKSFGKQAVERMNELGIAVDVSHLSEGGFFDVADVSSRPFAASHSCARALCDHSRNLTDRQLKTLADAGGVVGINYLTSFLREIKSENKADFHTLISDVMRHMEYIRNIAGTASLAFGSDYDGIECSLEWGDCSGNGMILEAMEKHFTPREIDLITHENALRFFRDACD